jgi:hypothetical protein
MGLYTRFYFRAKLRFDTPQVVLDLLHEQFKSWDTLKAEGKVTDGDLIPDENPIWEWQGWEKNTETTHAFFALKRPDRIPHATNFEDFPKPKCITYPDKSTVIEFTCEINYGYNEIIEFCRWIAPYVRMRYGKKIGRKQRRYYRKHRTDANYFERVWVGYMRAEGDDHHHNLFILMNDKLPRVEAHRWGQDLDW